MYAWEEDQTNYTPQDFNGLFQELRKIVDVAIDYSLYQSLDRQTCDVEYYGARTLETMKKNDALLRSLDLSKMTRETLALLKVTMYPDQPEPMIQDFPNLAPLRDVEPLEKPLYLNEDPLNLYDFVREMNIFE